MKKKSKYYERLLILGAYLFALPIFLFIKVRKIYLGTKPPGRFLIIPQLTRVGDVVCITPVLHAIKKHRPNAYVAVLISRKVKGALKNNPYVNELIIYEDYKYNFFRLLKKLHKTNFDIGFSFSGSPLSSLLFFVSCIPLRVKLIRPEPSRAACLTDWLTNMRIAYHHGMYLPLWYLGLLRYAGIQETEEVKEVFTTKLSEEVTDEFFIYAGIDRAKSLVGISVSAGNKIKEWGDEKFAELAGRLLQAETSVIFIGTPEDRVRLEKIAAVVPLKVGIATDFPLEFLPSLLKRMDVFISVDNGPMHIADALHVPLVDIIGPVCKGELTPHGEYVRVVEPEPAVPPTVFAFKSVDNLELTKQALTNTSVDKVYKAVMDLLRPPQV